LIDIQDKTAPSWKVYSGQMLIQYQSTNSTITSKEQPIIQKLLSQDFSIHCVAYYEIGLGIDYASNHSEPLQMEIGLYDHSTEVFELKEWINTQIGKLIYVIVETENEIHDIVMTSDSQNRMFALQYHTWKSKSVQDIIPIDNLNILTY
jgi:hypothetical protein